MLIPWLTFTLILAVWLDSLLGEPKRFHPLVGFGNIANWLERRLNQGSQRKQLALGMCAWGLIVLPLPLMLFWLTPYLQSQPFYIQLLFDACIVYAAIGLKSLYQHGIQIFNAIKAGDIVLARKYCGYIVSRDTSALTEQQMSRATVESMLENSHDAVTATLICYLIGGAPLVVLHRLANTLDAMWGYKNQRFEYFGKFAARADDVLGFIPAKITALLYALLTPSKFLNTLRLSHKQAKAYKSHNGGWVMAAGASAMRVQLGGRAVYHNKTYDSPILGKGRSVEPRDIATSLRQVHLIVGLLITVTGALEVLILWAR